MATPRVNKQQQLRKSLSAKKGLRNVLAQPYDTHWPVLRKDEQSCLEELLNRLLPGLRLHTPSIPWSQLRKMGKDERRAAREKLCPDSKEIESDRAMRKLVTLGVNAVTRDLEKEKLCSVLLDSGTEPLMIKHVIIMARNKDIPILLVPFLKKFTLDNIGFASAAMGLKVHQEIAKHARAVASTETVESSQDSSTSPIVEDAEMRVREKFSPVKLFSLSTDVYKYRSTRKERTFVPPSTVEQSSNNREEWGDFIAMGKDDTEMSAPKFILGRKNQRYMDVCAAIDDRATRKRVESDEYVSLDCEEASPEVKRRRKKTENITYLPLKVKRIQGNNNRVKATKSAKSKKKLTKK